MLAALAKARDEQIETGQQVTQSGAEFQTAKFAGWLAAMTGDFSRDTGPLQRAWTEDVLGTLQGLAVMIGAQIAIGLGLLTVAQVAGLFAGARRSEPVSIAHAINTIPAHTSPPPADAQTAAPGQAPRQLPSLRLAGRTIAERRAALQALAA